MARTKMDPKHDFIVVEPDARDVTPGGIAIPDVAQRMWGTGKVLAVGPGKVLDNGQRGPMSVESGDTVLYPYVLGALGCVMSVDIDIGAPVMFMRDVDILAVLP